MAITIWKPGEATPALAQTFAIDPALLQTKAAHEARRRGILIAKQQALRAAEGLLAWGRTLTWAVVFVSAIHIWETVAAIAPAHVGTLQLPAAIYHGAALAFTLMIDACALYIAKANAAAAFVGAPANRWTIYFYLVTALLNASFVARHAPAIDATVQAQLLPLLAGSFVLLLPLSIPAGIVAVEASNRTLEAARLALLVEVETLRGLVVSTTGSTRRSDEASRDSAAASVSEASAAAGPRPTAALSGHRPTAHTVAGLLGAITTDEIISPSIVRERLSCGETTAHKLLQDACAAGAIEKAGRGAYRVRQG
ncbi:hypothetical protein K2Z83_11780 [Oscillochloris sp. ZM17-4]|uniref:hypothetical protein n=1 Tax=Oscillochloris sp. ZM17-4 TaxID=2866714 RepID=UPI001C72B34B|nr:hypothetical protein [Oscillochloris sp. ZM17-4]MBX0328356.1 hypothetical protein [Oscillochloris sp. ZM17-4]